jgi:hypothetical protein
LQGVYNSAPSSSLDKLSTQIPTLWLFFHSVKKIKTLRKLLIV